MTRKTPRKDNFTRVFVSHKEEDKELAHCVSTTLQRDCQQLRCYVTGGSVGIDWREAIEEELVQADVLLLLFTSPAKEWDWPLYEVGLFTSLDGNDHRDVVYLYSGDHRPEPLCHIQGVKVELNDPTPDQENRDDLTIFLKEFYATTLITGTEPALRPNISETELRQRTQHIRRAFRDAAATVIQPTYRVVLAAPSGDEDSSDPFHGKIPESCKVEEITPPTLAVFGLATKPNDWCAATMGLFDQAWRDDLNDQYRRALDNKVAYPTRSTFRGVDIAKNFRAMITQLEVSQTRVMRIVIELIPEYMPAVVGGPAFNVLRIATRFRMEFLDQFQGQLDRRVRELGKDNAFKTLWGVLIGIEQEGRDFHHLDTAIVKSVFGEDGDDRVIAASMIDDWNVIRLELHQAVEGRDVARCEVLLTKLREVNARFLRMISRRHCQLIERDAAQILREE
jgi:hypothetical protein